MKSARLLALVLALTLLTGCTLASASDADPLASIPVETDTAAYSGTALTVINSTDSSEFGLIEDSYGAEGSTTTTLVSYSGDTDVLKPTGIRATVDSLDLNAVNVLFDAEFPIAFTALKYTDGEVTDNGGVLKLESGGIAEKYNADGTWTRAEFAELHTPGREVEFRSFNFGIPADEFPLLTDGAVSISLPFENPGVYRYTIYFRECIDSTVEHRTTGEELYELSMIFDIPKSDKLFDVVAVSAFEESVISEGTYEGEQGYVTSVLIRANTEDKYEALNLDPVYSLNHGGTLERLVGDEWAEIEDGLFSFESEAYWVSGHRADNYNRFLNTSSFINSYFPELKGEYRLRANFVYGDRDLAELPLNFNFGE